MSSIASLGAQFAKKIHSGIGDYDVAVKPSGEEAQDTSAIARAVAYCNSEPRARLWLEGELLNSTPHSFSRPVQVFGRGGGAVIKSTSSQIFQWNPGGFPSSPSSGHYNVDVVYEGYDYFDTDAFAPSPGDALLIYSQDLTGAFPHTGIANGQYPAELHKVEWYDSDNKRIHLTDCIKQGMSTDVRVAVLPALPEDIIIKDLTFEYVGESQAPSAYTIWVRGSNNLLIENVHIRQSGTGAVNLQYPFNPRINNLTIEGTAAVDNVYGLMISLANGLVASGVNITGTRHAVTTSSSFASGNDRYGSIINSKVTGGVIRIPPKLSGVTRSGLDTHSEGGDLTFDNLKIITGIGQIGASNRAPGTKYTNCHFTGRYSSGSGILNYGPNMLVKHCIFEGIGLPISTMAQYDAAEAQYYYDHCDGTTVEDCTFINCQGPALRVRGGNNHRFRHNTIEGCSWRVGGTPAYESAIVDIDYGSGHQIVGNAAIRSTNEYFVAQNDLGPPDIYVADNAVGGYGTGKVGFQDSATQQYMESAYRNSNRILSTPAYATDGDTSPSVDGIEVLVVANTVSTTIAGFDDPADGQLLTLIVTDGNTQVEDNAEIECIGGANWQPGSSGGEATFSYSVSDGFWTQLTGRNYT